MAQDFYSLEEAANLLGLPADELNRMAQQRKVRAFADRGTWRFRRQEIDEMVRQQGGAGNGEADLAGNGDAHLAGDADLGLAEEPAPAPVSGLATAPPPAVDDDLIPFDEGLELDLKPGSGVNHPKTDEDLIPIDDLLDSSPPPTVAGPSAVNLGDDLATVPAASSSKPSTLKPAEGGSDVRLVLEEGSSEFELAMDSSPALQEQATAPPSAPRITGTRPPSALDPGMDLGLEAGPPSVLDSDPNPGLGMALASEPAVLDLAPEPGPALDLAAEPGPALDLAAEPGPALDLAADPAADQAPPTEGHDSDVRVDFDSSTLDDSMVSIGGQEPDSDVRLDLAGTSQVSRSGAPVESMPTEEIDLDAELQQADQASMERRGKTKNTPAPQPMAPGATHLSSAPKGTMLPTSSPFELSEDDLEFSGTGDSNVNRPLGSEFELTLAPEDEPSPLNLGDDEDIDLGGLPPKDGLSSSARAELSGINLHNPADSGVSLDKDGSSESVDFELTVDDDAAGPKTIKGKLPDSDSEFELTLEEGSDEMLPAVDGDLGSDSGDQKDIFETDFDLKAVEGGESHSEAVALDGSDTDLESSDFDLAVSDTDLERHAGAVDESGSEVVVLPDEEEGEPAAAPRKSRVTGGSLDSVDELLLDEDGLEVEEEDEDEVAPAATVPAAQAEWGMFPILLLLPSVLVMFLAGLMSYELLHGMWGYHAASKPSGLVVRGVAGLFVEKLPED
jgi:excisionase family DNA binding protein